MYIIEVIPLTVLPPQVPQILTYFSDRPLPRGAVVQVPIQKKEVSAVVISSGTLEQQKIAVKKSDFQLKPITKVLIESSQVSARQFQIALWLAKHYYAPLGMCLNAVLPPFFAKRDYILNLNEPSQEPPSELAIAPPLFIEVRASQTLVALEPYIKDTIRHGGQVLLVCPDIVPARHLFEQLKSLAPAGFISSDLSNKEYYDLWQKVAGGEYKIIVGTRAGLFLPFRDLWMIAVEDPFHESYKSDFSPKYNVPDVALKIGALSGARLFFTAPIPNINIAQAIEQRVFEYEHRRAPAAAVTQIVDIGYERKSGNFSALSRPLQQHIIASLAAKEQIMLISARRAYAGVLMCQNCSTVVNCPNCDIPLRVHQTTETMLVCYHCSAYQNIPKSCATCHSVDLKPSGIAGSQKIQEAVLELLNRHQIGGVETFILDSDLIRDDQQERELLDQIAAAPQAIVIATQLAFSHRYTHHYDLIGIINVDALMSNADFRTEERFLTYYQKLLDFNPDKIILQTYNPTSPTLAAAITEDYQSFYQKELPLRRMLGYPPYSRLVKLTFSHASNAKAAYESRLLNERLRRAIALEKLEDKVQLVSATPAQISREKNQYHYSALLKINPDLTRIDTILKYVPSAWHIDVDPRQIL